MFLGDVASLLYCLFGAMPVFVDGQCYLRRPRAPADVARCGSFTGAPFAQVFDS